MKSLMKLFIQNLDGFILRENFIIASIVTIFVIRIFLRLTHYPELSGNGLHIAHLLWGGFFMVTALILLLSFLGRNILTTASILGGIGFGAFIDELGKFITSDNNYFFQPTIAIIYVIFILLYSISKVLARPSGISPKEYLVNALAMVTEAVINDLDDDEKKRAQNYLLKSDSKDPLVKSLKVFLSDIQAIPTPPPSLFNRIRHTIEKFYQQLTRSQILSRIIVLLLLSQSIFPIVFLGVIFLRGKSLSFTQQGELVASILSIIFVLAGVIVMQKSRINGFRLFKLAILISLLITQFFIFYTEQFRALLSLAVNVILLTVIDYTLDHQLRMPNGSSNEKQ